jgi:hypothetical protein
MREVGTILLYILAGFLPRLADMDNALTLHYRHGQMEEQNCWHEGKLVEISPFGTGFIEDVHEGGCYGFQMSMLPEHLQPFDPSSLEGSRVRFVISESGIVEGLCFP